MAAEGQVPADEFAADALKKVGDGFLSIVGLASMPLDGHGISPDEMPPILHPRS